MPKTRKAKIDKRHKLDTADKRYKLLTPEQIEIFKANGIPGSTVRHRIHIGWDIDRAITEPSKPTNTAPRGELGMFSNHEKGERGKQRGFRLPKRLEPAFEKAIADRGMSQSELIVEIISQWLEIEKAIGDSSLSQSELIVEILAQLLEKNKSL